MLGTMRSLSPMKLGRLREDRPLLAAGIAAAHWLTAEVRIAEGFPVTICNEAAVAFGERVAHAMFGGEAFLRLRDPIMGAEDFASVLEKVPGAMFFLGVSYKDADWQHCCGLQLGRAGCGEHGGK